MAQRGPTLRMCHDPSTQKEQERHFGATTSALEGIEIFHREKIFTVWQVATASEEAFDEGRLLAVDERFQVVGQVQFLQASHEDEGLEVRVLSDTVLELCTLELFTWHRVLIETNRFAFNEHKHLESPLGMAF